MAEVHSQAPVSVLIELLLCEYHYLELYLLHCHSCFLMGGWQQHSRS